MCTTQTLLKALPTSIQGIMNSCIENNLISDMSVRSWKQNLPVGVLNYLLCHYTSPRSFRPIHLIISLLHLCSVHKGTTTHTLERSKGELQSSVQKLGGEMYFLLWKFTVIHTFSLLLTLKMMFSVQKTSMIGANDSGCHIKQCTADTNGP